MLQSIPFPNLTNNELFIVSAHLSEPVVKKYFRGLAIAAITDLTEHGEPAEGESVESLLRRQNKVRGHIELLETLLLVEVGKDPEEKQISGNNPNNGNPANQQA